MAFSKRKCRWVKRLVGIHICDAYGRDEHLDELDFSDYGKKSHKAMWRCYLQALSVQEEDPHNFAVHPVWKRVYLKGRR